MERIVRGVLWHRVLDGRSMEAAWLSELDAGWAISGAITGAEGDAPLEAHYRLECDKSWRTSSLHVRQKRANDQRALILRCQEGVWSSGDTERPDLAGCVDVDLGLSPSTNSLPINRLRLRIGEEKELRVAWIRFPALEVVMARQSYLRLGERSYRYASLSSGFQAVVEVDDYGLVRSYEGIWNRVAETPL